MGVDLQWNLLTDAGANLGNALGESGRIIGKRRSDARDADAIADYDANPDDAQTFRNLVKRSPEAAFKLRDDRAAAMKQLSETHREQLRVSARLLKNVKDEPSYQQARAAAGELGFDLSEVPPTFDPNWVGQVVTAGSALEPASSMEPTTFQKDLRGAGIDPASPEGVNLLRNRYASPPKIVTGPNGELLLIPQDVGLAPGAAAPSDDLEAQAEEAIRQGADPEAVRARLQQMKGGAGSGPRTFP